MNKKSILTAMIILIIIPFIAGWVIGTSSFFNDESKEIDCLRLYKDIRELSRTPGMALTEQNTLENQKSFVEQYIENKCPDFPDLELMYESLKNIPLDGWTDITDTTLESNLGQ